MLTKAFCLAKAAECEAVAARKLDQGLRYEWLHTAGEWRLTALILTEEPQPAAHRRPAPPARDA